MKCIECDCRMPSGYGYAPHGHWMWCYGCAVAYNWLYVFPDVEPLWEFADVGGES